MKNKFIWLIVVVIVLSGTWYLDNREPTEKEVIKIGFIGPLSGDLASWGVEAKNSVAMAISEINTNSGIDGRMLEIIYEDGECDGTAASSAAQKLINIDKVKIIITYCSLETMTVAPIAEKNKIVLFAPAATSPEISGAGDYVFRLAPSDKQPAEALARFLDDKFEKIAIITEISAFSKDFHDNIVATLKKTDVVFDESFSPGSRDFYTLIAKMRQVNPDAVIANANTPITEGLIIKQIAELGLDLPRYGIYWGSDPEFLATAGKSAEGFIYYNFTANMDNSRVREFLNKYETNYSMPPPNPQFAILSYDAPFILAKAIKETGCNADKIRDYLYSMKIYDALSGNIAFDENGDSQGITFTLFMVKNGEFVEYE